MFEINVFNKLTKIEIEYSQLDLDLKPIYAIQ